MLDLYCFLRFYPVDCIIFSRLLIGSKYEVSVSKHKDTEVLALFSLFYVYASINLFKFPHFILVGMLFMQDYRSNTIDVKVSFSEFLRCRSVSAFNQIKMAGVNFTLLQSFWLFCLCGSLNK